jgi:hypothetical protein
MAQEADPAEPVPSNEDAPRVEHQSVLIQMDSNQF